MTWSLVRWGGSGFGPETHVGPGPCAVYGLPRPRDRTAHLPASMGLTLAGSGRTPRPPETAALLRHVPSVPFGERRGVSSWRAGSPPPSSRQLGGAVLAVILERHRAVAVGEEPDDRGGSPGACRGAVQRLAGMRPRRRAWCSGEERPGCTGPLPRRRRSLPQPSAPAAGGAALITGSRRPPSASQQALTLLC